MDGALDFMSSILDEVALEGLDGITVSSLWVRLEKRAHFPIALDERSKSFLWECIAIHKDIEMYELPSPRPVLKIFNRYEYVDDEFGLITEPPFKLEEIYPIKMIEDGNIRGSCTTFDERVCVTSSVRHGTVLVMSLKQVLEKWQDTLVLVSSPKSRFLALVGTEVNPLLELTKEQYCLLERIGRSRYHGEVSQGENGILSLNCGSIKDHLHYHAGKLMAYNLIIKQKHVLRLKPGKTVSGSLFHLTRFYQQRKMKFDTLLECLYEALKNKQKHREQWNKLQEELGIPETTFRKLLKKFAHKWFKLILVPYREVYPEATPSEYKGKNGEERSVKMVQMTHSYLEDDDSYGEEEDKNVSPHFDPSKLLIDKPLVCQVFDAIRKRGPSGMSLSEIRQALTLPRLDTRALCRLLLRRNEVVKLMQDKGRQRYEKYVAKEFELQQSWNDIDNAIEANTDKETNEESIKLAVEEKSQKISAKREEKEFENIISEVIEFTDNMILNKKSKISLTPLVSSPGKTIFPRVKKRAGLLVSYIKRAKFTTLPELTKVITTEETKEGYKHKIDKKSLLRLIDWLRSDKLVKVYNAIFKLNDNVKEMKFVCYPNLDPSDLEFKAVIEQAKFKCFCASNSPKKELSKENKLSARKGSEKTKHNGNTMNKPLTFLASQGYGHPKFVRSRSLHLLLCYLVNHYEGDSQQDDVDKIYSYHPNNTWRQFIPPLPQYQRAGWCILSDAISRIPLSLFTKIVGTRYVVKELNELMEDPIKQHYLIRHLPLDLRNHLLCGRRYLFQISDVLNKLCQMGLVSLGPRVLFEKDQVYVYIHKKAMIKDTTVTPPGYLRVDDNINYEMKTYEFETLTDVENYWIDLETICLQTALGKYSTVAGQKIVILDPNQKPELVEAIKNKEFEQVVDEGICPGDGLGAGGLDSSLYSHFKRNWHGPTLYKGFSYKPKTDFGSLRFLLDKGAKNTGVPNSRVRLQRLTKQVLVPKKRPLGKPNDADSPPLKRMRTEKKHKKKIRVIKSKVRRGRQQFYDAKDKSVLKLINKMRAGWSPQEDTLLLLCKVTSVFLEAHSKLLVVPFTVIRDVLHEKFPQLSFDKTSRACQRRLRHILLNSQEARYSVDIFLGEAKQDLELVKEFTFPKPPRTREAEWRSIFLKLFHKLLQKFSSSQESKEIELPETAESLKLKYNIVPIVSAVNLSLSSYSKPQTENEIQNNTVGNIMLASFHMEDEIKPWSYVLYKIYEHYSENMLKSVIGEFSKKQLIAKHKTFLKSQSKQLFKHPSSIPYRFSITYHNTFLQKYPLQIHEDACKMLKELNSGRIQLDPLMAAGYTTTLISLIMCNQLKTDIEIPDPVVVFDKSFADQQYIALMKEIMSDEDDDDSQDLSRLLSVKNIAVQNNEAEEPKSKRQKFDEGENPSVFSPAKSASTDENPELQTLSQCSRLAFHMLHTLSKSKLDPSSTTTDELSVIPCTIFCELSSETDSLLSLFSEINIEELVKNVIVSYTSYIPNTFLHDIDHKNVLYNCYTCMSPSSMQEGEIVFDMICSFGSFGISHLELLAKFSGEMSLEHHLLILIQSKLILRVGVVEFCYVGVMHSKPWLISSFVSNTFIKEEADSECFSHPEGADETPQNESLNLRPRKKKKKSGFEKISSDLTPVLYVPRPWRKPDGSLNSDPLVKWLRTLLNYILSLPGVSEKKVCERFALSLQPVHILELLEILEKATCISRCYVVKNKKNSLFSSCFPTVSSSMTNLDDTVHYQSNPEAVVQMKKLCEEIFSCTYKSHSM